MRAAVVKWVVLACICAVVPAVATVQRWDGRSLHLVRGEQRVELNQIEEAGDDPSPPDPPEEWDARLQIAVGKFIRQHMRENPPPATAAYAEHFASWAGQLIEAGRSDLAALGDPGAQAILDQARSAP